MEKKTTIAERYFEKPSRLKTFSGIPVKEVYTPEDIKDIDYHRDMGNTGEFPYTRGIFPDMYRGRLWSMRELCGYGSPRATNERLHFLIEEGESALNFIGDLPTQYGIDSDHPFAEGEVGVEGVPLCSLQDMEEATEGIPLDQASFNISNYLCPTLAMYIAAAEKRGFDLTKLRGTHLNDTISQILVRYVPVPLDLGIRMTVDSIIHCLDKVPRYYTLSTGPEGLRESGATAAQEIGLDFCIARFWIQKVLERGKGKINIDDFAGKVTFTHRVGIDIFEEACKFRAARRVWARMLRDEFGAQSSRSLTYKVHTPTMGTSLVRPQTVNNIIRIAYQTLAAVLGGVQSIHTMGFDEPQGLPTEESHRIALRTQQILCYETGVVNVADPLGGSYYVEWLTNELEKEILKVMEEWKEDIAGRAERGEVIDCLFREAYKYQQEVERGERIIVGLNKFTIEEKPGEISLHVLPEDEVKRHLDNLKELRKSRDNTKVAQALDNLRRVTENTEENIFPAILEAVKAYATLGEIMGVMRMGYGHDYDPFEALEYPFS